MIILVFMNIIFFCVLYKSYFIFEYVDVKEEVINFRVEVKLFDYSKLKYVEIEEKVFFFGVGGKFLKIVNFNFVF